MRLRTALIATLGLLAVLGALGLAHRLATAPPEPGALVERVREVARLETLEVRLSTTVAHEPHPGEASSLAGEMLSWAMHTLAPKTGHAQVAGVARLGLDLSRLETGAMQASGRRVLVRLPPIVSHVELDLERTELLQSNLDSAQTQELFEKGRRAIAAQVEADAALHARARASAENALRSLFLSVGYEEVVFLGSAPSI